ncbi:hypothetical protein Bbelb_440810 [Branchiostoma belcheri]|nr:hypothetical protein Bbelb_440810 [Branchiostoma belcheri]
MASTSCCRQSPSHPNHVSIKVQRKGGGVVVDWYTIDCGQGDVTLYEKLVTASEFRPVNFRDILSRTASAQLFCNEGRVGRGVEVYAGLQVGHACRQFGHFVRIEVDKTAASEGAEVPRPKSAFEGILAYSVGFLRSLKSSALPVNPFLKSQLRFLGLLKVRGRPRGCRGDILAITETWLNDDVRDQEVIPPGYATYRKDRHHTHAGRAGGGILLAVSSNVRSRRRPDLEPKDEILVCEVQPPGLGKLATVLCYRPPSGDLSTFTVNLSSALEKVKDEYRMYCVLGDLNLPKVDWNSCAVTDRGKESDFCEVINDHFLYQHNMIPSNHCNHILDLVFTNIPEKVSSIKELPTEFDTDHTILEFGIHCRLQPKRGLSRKVFNYRRADWDGLRAHLVSRQLTEAVEQYQDIDSAWEFFFFSQPVRALAEGERFNYASMD